jgi:hypothetical protein
VSSSSRVTLVRANWSASAALIAMPDCCASARVGWLARTTWAEHAGDIGGQAPQVQVVHVQHAVDVLDDGPDLLGVESAWGSLHEHVDRLTQQT